MRTLNFREIRHDIPIQLNQTFPVSKLVHTNKSYLQDMYIVHRQIVPFGRKCRWCNPAATLHRG